MPSRLPNIHIAKTKFLPWNPEVNVVLANSKQGIGDKFEFSLICFVLTVQIWEVTLLDRD